MEILTSVLGREVEAVLKDPTNPPLYQWDCVVYVGANPFKAMKVLNIDFEEDPEKNYAPNIVVRAVFGAGDYYKQILPNDKTLEISLFRYNVNLGTGGIDYNQPFNEERYSATIFDKKDVSQDTSTLDSLSQELLNVTNIVEVQFQLLNKAIEQLRLMTVGGVYRKSNNTDILKTLITNSFSKLDVEHSRIPIGVDMVEASNTETKESVVIPQGLKIVDLPDYLQNKCDGVYNAGLGHFIKDEYWYIYPKYNVKRFGETRRTINIIRVPANKMPFVEKTYRVTGDTISILATAETSKIDVSEQKQKNEGSGARYAKADNFLEEFVSVKDNIATIARGANVNEFEGTDRPKNSSTAFLSEDKIVSNDYKQFSDVVKRQGNLYTFVWENSDMELVLPAMLVTIQFISNEDIKEMRGVLLAVHHSIMVRGKGAFARSYITRSVMNIFIDPNADLSNTTN